MAGLLDVVINTGQLPSAVGVAEGYDLSRVIAQWQSVANGRFQNDCRALKQMIRETDELRLWEKNVGGSRFKDRDDFLRRKVLIDYELTERDFTEIVAALYRDPGKASRKLREKAGAPRLEERNPNDVVNIIRGTNKPYILARLARDHPDLLKAYEHGEFKSARAAGIAAGFIKPPTPLETAVKAYRKLSPEEQKEFWHRAALAEAAE